MKNTLFATLIAVGTVFAPQTVSAHTPQQVRAIEQEYARVHSGRTISDAQLEYYLDRSDSGWSMRQIGDDMAAASRRYGDNPWRPQTGYVAQEVICSSIDGRYSECRVPFRGTAMITSQISDSACIEGRTWGNKPGANASVWVKDGCRARFGIVRTNSAPGPARGERATVRTIEQEYARLHNGRMISDAQLEYYLDRADSGWSLRQISDNMAAAMRSNGNNPWRPQPGYVAREVVCSSIDRRYTECRVPFRGTAMITSQISDSACTEGRTWGNKPGANASVWVKDGCRARFGVVRTGTAPGQNNRLVVCQSYKGRYRECPTGFRGDVQLSRRLNKSAACVEGRTWGQKPGVVWVSRGCRAQFTSVGRPGPGDDDNRDRNYMVTCASTDHNQVRCNWNERYGRPRLDRQLSQSACVEGRTWGYERDDLWVSNGCRARFGVR